MLSCRKTLVDCKTWFSDFKQFVILFLATFLTHAKMDTRTDGLIFLIGYILCLLMGGGNCQISDAEVTSTEESVIISLSLTSNQPGETSPVLITSPTVAETSSTTEVLTPTPTELHETASLSTTLSSPEANQESTTDATTLINTLSANGSQTELEVATSSSMSPYTETTQYPLHTEVRVAPEQDTDHFTFTSIQHDRETSTTDITMPLTSRSSLVSLVEASTAIPILRTTNSEQSPHVNASAMTESIESTESSTVISTTLGKESSSQTTSILSSSESSITSTQENTTTILSTTPYHTAQSIQIEISTPSIITRSQTPNYPMTTKISEFTTQRTTLPSITQPNTLEEVTKLATSDDVVKNTVSTSLPDPDADNTTRVEDISRTDIQRIYWTKNEIIVVIIVMFVLNVFNLIVVVLCVMHIVNNRSQRWEPPPSRFGSRSRYTNSRPQLECVRTIGGCDLASDSECKSEEKPLQTVSIISKDSGWCVPIAEQKNKADQTADTGV